MSSASSFRQELDSINRELRKSLLKLQSLLEKKRRATSREYPMLNDRDFLVGVHLGPDPGEVAARFECLQEAAQVREAHARSSQVLGAG